jgi:hypothetical protein
MVNQEALVHVEPSEQHKIPSFSKVFKTPVELHTMAKKRSPFVEVTAGFEVVVEGAISWQQYCEKFPKKNDFDVWILVEDPKAKKKYFVTRGDINRLPEGQKAEDQPAQHKLTREAALGTSARFSQKEVPEPQSEDQVEAEAFKAEEQSETEVVSFFSLPPKMRFFLEQPKARAKEESIEERDAYLDNIADWKTRGRTELIVNGTEEEIKKSRDSYIHGVVSMLSHADWLQEGKDGKVLDLGQKVCISKRNYFEVLKRLKQEKDAKQARAKAA